jgi:hypothetical protein
MVRCDITYVPTMVHVYSDGTVLEYVHVPLVFDHGICTYVQYTCTTHVPHLHACTYCTCVRTEQWYMCTYTCTIPWYVHVYVRTYVRTFVPWYQGTCVPWYCTNGTYQLYMCTYQGTYTCTYKYNIISKTT